MSNKHLLLGVSGSIAAYRSPDLCSSLRREGYEVKTILSKSAEQFVTKTSVQTMSHGKVYNNSDQLIDTWHPAHIELADWTEVAIIAPATATTIGKLACGIADGLLTETFLALGPNVQKFIAPAMNGNMLNQPSIQRNLEQLNADGFTIIQTRVGELACGYQGDGKLASTKEIIENLDN